MYFWIPYTKLDQGIYINRCELVLSQCAGQVGMAGVVEGFAEVEQALADELLRDFFLVSHLN